MGKQLIGQLLSSMGKLSPLDIDEILADQAVTKRRFGEIALSWGLCEPEHISEAWSEQLRDETHGVDLRCIGIDAGAALRCPPGLADALDIIPIRDLGGILIVAAARPLDSVQLAELVRAVNRDVRFVYTDAESIHEAISMYLSPAAAA